MWGCLLLFLVSVNRSQFEEVKFDGLLCWLCAAYHLSFLYLFKSCLYALENISLLLEFNSVLLKDNTDYSRRTIRNT
jgi:hypothetical protein